MPIFFKSKKVKFLKLTKYEILWSNMTLFGIIINLHKTSESHKKSLKNTPEVDLNTFCNITSHITLKYLWDF